VDRVAREVVEGQAQIQARRKQIAVAEAGLKAATGSYQKNLQRIRDGQGLPIEALQSIQALDQARREYPRTVADYSEAQFRLCRALGCPIGKI
jgi:outer membrane protein TolC